MSTEKEIQRNEGVDYTDEKYEISGLKDIDPNDDNYGFEDIAHFTWRSVIVGSLIGIIVVASNMYLGLKAGNTFSAAMLGAVLGFVVMKPLSLALPEKFGGGYFGIRENCSLQSAATAVGSLSAGFQSGIPAIYLLDRGLLPPIDDAWGILLLWTTAAAFHGLFFGIPLRNYFIIQRKLIFPTPTAAAESIKTLHSSANAEKSAFQQGRWIFGGFAAMFLWKILSYFVPFIWDFHILYWIGTAANYPALITADTQWKWRFQTTGAFVGSGMLVGLNTGISFLAGSIFSFGIVGPLMQSYTDILTKSKAYGFSKDGKPTAQYWFIWPGVTILIVATFTELLLNYKTIFNAFSGMTNSLRNQLARFLPFVSKTENIDYNEIDPVPSHLRIPTWVWAIGLTCTSVFSILVLHFSFEVTVGGCFLSLFLGFLLAFIGCQSAGDIDINPMGSIGKITQITFSGLSFPTENIALKVNLISGVASMSTAAQAVDMVSDLKTGHILRASPKSQFYAQTVGSIVGIFAAVVMFWVFGKAYPCALDKNLIDKCQFQVPAGVAWASVAEALIGGVNSIPVSSGYACLAFGIFTFIIIVLKRTYLKKYAAYIPNMNAFGMAFVTPTPYIPIAQFLGALIREIWKRYDPENYEIGVVGLASGFLAGEGIGGVVHAIFNVAGLDQAVVATGFACPSEDAANCSD
ncbi:OPT oligopeptide transporter [Neoconidiobolus thromboides FSU 785]|nr:OPT oligopeptide transporter [Neoconidiobolus thromboides FSU 785]